MKNNTGFEIREGRTNKQYINTNFDFIDAINKYADCETLGFYIGFKRFINRKDNTKDNQITYSQKYLEKQLNIGWRKYYKHLKTLFNAGLCDIEKIITVKFFVNYNIEGKENPLIEKSILFFSTLDNINIPLKDNIENLIHENYPEIPVELIKIVDVVNRNSYIFHDYPPIKILEDNHYSFVAYRNWEDEMKEPSKEIKTENKSDVNPESHNGEEGEKEKSSPVSHYGKDPYSHNGGDPISQNGTLNNIIKLNNNINELDNIIINQSIENIQNESKLEDQDDNKEKDGLTDFDKQLKRNEFKTFEELINYVGVDKRYFEYPYTEWIGVVRKAIWEMYSFDNTKILGKKIGRYDVIAKLQNLNIDVIINTIDRVIEKGREEKIKHPVSYIKTAMFNEIDEFSARIQLQLSYDFNHNSYNSKTEDMPQEKHKTRFHNFKSRTDNYSEEDLEAIVRRKREKYMEGMRQ